MSKARRGNYCALLNTHDIISPPTNLRSLTAQKMDQAQRKTTPMELTGSVGLRGNIVATVILSPVFFSGLAPVGTMKLGPRQQAISVPQGQDQSSLCEAFPEFQSPFPLALSQPGAWEAGVRTRTCAIVVPVLKLPFLPSPQSSDMPCADPRCQRSQRSCFLPADSAAAPLCWPECGTYFLCVCSNSLPLKDTQLLDM